MEGTPIRRSFDDATRLCLKLSNYFDVYDRLFAAYVGTPVVLVEFGVLHGGSLQMWRGFLGNQARIIGVDVNPRAKQLEAEGFEIWTVDQEDHSEITQLFESLGPVDIVVDDGAHTNAACVNTLLAAAKAIRPGGVHVVEDLHTSFLSDFGNPDRSSVFALGVALARSMSMAYGEDLSGHPLEQVRERVRSVEFLPSLMALKFRDDGDPWTRPVAVTNAGRVDPNIGDMRNASIAELGAMSRLNRLVDQLPPTVNTKIRPVALWGGRRARDTMIAAARRRRNGQLVRELKTRGQWWG